MNDDIEVLKIPAFQRKKSLAKRAEKVIPWTALDRQREALLKEQKKVNKYADPVRVPKKKFRKNLSLSGKFSAQSNRNFFGANFSQPIIFPDSSPPVLTPFLAPVPSLSVSSRYQIIGTVTHYLDRIQVAIIRLSMSLKKDDLIAIEDENGIFFQVVSSMQIDRKDVKTAKKGSEIGMKINQIPKIGGKVFKGNVR